MQTRADQLTTDAALKWTSKLAGNKLQVDAVLGWHRALAGTTPVDRDLDRRARLRVARVAGHARLRSAGAYIGAIRRSSAGSRDPAQGETGKPGARSIGDDGDTAAPIT